MSEWNKYRRDNGDKEIWLQGINLADELRFKLNPKSQSGGFFSRKQAESKGVELLGAHLDGANLSNAHLEGAILRFANLERANLSHAHLEYSSFNNTILKRADFSSTDENQVNISLKFTFK